MGTIAPTAPTLTSPLVCTVVCIQLISIFFTSTGEKEKEEAMCPILEDKVRSDRSSFEFYRRLPWSPHNLFKFHHIRVLKYLIENPENKVTQKKERKFKQKATLSGALQ